VLGILLIDKPKGITSHDVVDRVRRAFSMRRVGHAGTLDPMATGLLVVAVGAATRFLQYLPLEPKEYEGTIRLGQSSSTYDTEGELSEPVPVPQDIEERASKAVRELTGLIQQLPPLYSAVKVSGKPLYAYARKGQDVERTPRTVHVESFELVFESRDTARFSVQCSGGTYIRTLADDLGRIVGCGAHLTELRRTRAGAFFVEDAVALEGATPEHLIALARALPPMRLIELSEEETASIRQGRRVALQEALSEELVGLKDATGYVVGVARVQGHELQPECVLPLEAGL